MKANKAIIVVLVVAAVGSTVLLLPVRQWFTDFENYIRSFGAAGPLIVVLIYVLSTVLFIPASAITVGAGSLFGLQIGFVVVILGANLGALCSFLLARSFLREKVATWAAGNAKFRSLDRAIGRQG